MTAVQPHGDVPCELKADAADIDVLHSKTAADEAAKAKSACDQLFAQNEQLLFQYATDMQYLQHQVMDLTGKVSELEKWKQGALFQMRELREQHKALRRKCGEDPAEAPLILRATTLPVRSTSEPVPPTINTGMQQPSREGETIGNLAVPPAAGPAAIDAADGDGGVQVSESTVEGAPSMKAVWRIAHFSSKLRGAMGRPVVSPSFKVWDLDEVRLMVTPDGHEGAKNPRTRREKEQFTKMVSDGPLDGCLKLKVPNSQSTPLEYFLTVGTVRKGPFKFDFSISAVNGCHDFNVNWLAEISPDSSIVVNVEMLKPSSEISPT